jgi:hypothetical protein
MIAINLHKNIIMKKTILILLLIAAASLKSQVKFSTLGFDSMPHSIMRFDGIGADEKGNIRIYGDTLTAIKFIYKRMREADSINVKLWELIGAGVKFTNNLPGYYKTLEGNCRWPAYKKQLIKNGYHVYDSKKKFEPCK